VHWFAKVVSALRCLRGAGESRAVAYGVAVLSVGLAVLFRMALDPILGERYIFPTFLIACTVCAWFGGLGPAMLSLTLALLVAWGTFGAGAHDSQIALASAIYFLVGSVIALLGHSMRTAERRAQDRAADVRASEARYRSLVEATASIVWVTDGLGSLVEAPKWTDFTGQTAEEYRGQGWLAAVHPEDREPTLRTWAKAIRAGRPANVSYRLRARDGGYRWVVARGVPIAGEDGHVREWIGTVSDVDAARRAEHDLRESEERLRMALDAAHLRVWDWEVATDHVRRYLASATPSGDDVGVMVGVREQLIARLHPEDRDRVRAELDAAVAGRGYLDVEYRLLRRDGSVRWVHDVGRVVPAGEGRPLRVTGISRDTTEGHAVAAEREQLLRIAEQARMEAEATAELMRGVQTITDATLANLTMEALLAELLERITQVLDVDRAAILLHEPDLDALVVRAASRGFEGQVAGKTRIPTGHGFAGRVAVERRPLVIEEIEPGDVVDSFLRQEGIRCLLGVPLLVEGRVLGVIEVGSRRSRRFRDDDVALLRLVADRVALAIERVRATDAEQRARAAAEAADRAKDEFLAMLGHELRNPLAAVRNAVAAARIDEPRRERALDIAQRQTDQLARLIDDLLDVARITQGRITLRKEVVSLGDVLERALEATRALVEGQGHTIDVSFASGDVRVEADPVRLEQVLVNLLTNAAKYTEPGGRIDVRVEGEGAAVRVRIRDSGMGIRPEMLPRVFDLFAQGDRALDRGEGGLGVGLTVVRRLVELHGWRIDAHSDGPGRGAEFTIRLPAVSAADGGASLPAPAVPPRGQVRVLLVEDNPDAAESLVMLLEILGHQVRVVHDGLAALDVAPDFAPEVMLVDIGLPGIDGYEVARRVRGQPDLGGVVLVALTGYGRDEDRRLAFAAGFDHHLVKPVDLTALERLVAGIGGAPATTGEPPTLH
jgi:PAS domain S-box-containing protein